MPFPFGWIVMRLQGTTYQGRAKQGDRPDGTEFSTNAADFSEVRPAMSLAYLAPHIRSLQHRVFATEAIFVKGEARFGLGDDMKDAVAGTFVHMPPGLKHSIKAKTPVVMLLALLK